MKIELWDKEFGGPSDFLIILLSSSYSLFGLSEAEGYLTGIDLFRPGRQDTACLAKGKIMRSGHLSRQIETPVLASISEGLPSESVEPA